MSQGPTSPVAGPSPYGPPQFQPPPAPYGPASYGPASYRPASYGPPPAYPVVPVPWVPAPVPYRGVSAADGPPQRPAVVALGCTLAVVASLQWICGLSLLWVAAAVGSNTFDAAGDNGAVFHILSRFEYRMIDGLAVPLYLFPLASLVTGFLVLSRRPWARLAHTVVGLAALAWAAWWLQDNLLWWFSAAWYVVVGCLVLWTPGATAWYRWREQSRSA